MPEELLRLENLRVDYPVHGGILKRVVDHVRAVRGVSFTVTRGETVALIGESGCGKTTAGMAALGLAPVSGGRILWKGRDTAAFGHDEWMKTRREMQVVFQDPFASLNPRLRVSEIVAEGLLVHSVSDPAGRKRIVAETLRKVGLDESAAEKYPHEFSGGQRQRIAIARALAVDPEFLILDEAVSALDVLVQAQILDLLRDLRKSLGLTFLFITHDLGVVEYLADRVIVMYLGRIMEEAPTDALFDNPLHPYTKALLSARAGSKNRVKLAGEIPSARRPPEGCPFHTRCSESVPECRGEVAMKVVGADRRAACVRV